MKRQEILLLTQENNEKNSYPKHRISCSIIFIYDSQFKAEKHIEESIKAINAQ
jgi:hypothetical protein